MSGIVITQTFSAPFTVRQNNADAIAGKLGLTALPNGECASSRTPMRLMPR